MRKLLKNLEVKKEILENKIEQRQEVFDNKSDSWYEGEKCEEYEERSEILNDALLYLEETIGTLELCADELDNY